MVELSVMIVDGIIPPLVAVERSVGVRAETLGNRRAISGWPGWQTSLSEWQTLCRNDRLRSPSLTRPQHQGVQELGR